ncbi:PH domain-containing protein [Haloplanus salilacus]|uniref:PH domain-containing protein n=1 Tax=Haloplanus salilacus TaxID=2949994 RepID=UPI0030D3EBF6
MAPRPDWLPTRTDEAVVWRGAPRLRRVLPTVAASSCWIALLVAVAVVSPGPTRSVPRVVLVGGAVLLSLPAIAVAAGAYLRTANVEYVLTERSVYRKTGVWSTTVTRLGLDTVQRTALNKDLWGNLFDYGTISISTAGSGGVDLRLSDLDDPEPVRRRLRRLVGSGRSHDAPSGLDAATADTLSMEFHALHEAADRLEVAVSDR